MALVWIGENLLIKTKQHLNQNSRYTKQSDESMFLYACKTTKKEKEKIAVLEKRNLRRMYGSKKINIT